MQVYEKYGYISIEKWSRIDVGSDSKLSYDPNMEILWRNQEAAHTDCFLKYKVYF